MKCPKIILAILTPTFLIIFLATISVLMRKKYCMKKSLKIVCSKICFNFLVSTGLGKPDTGFKNKINNMTIETNVFLETEFSFLFGRLKKS